MKIIVLAMLLSSLFLQHANAQQLQEKVYIKTGDTLNALLSKGFQYLYPDFIPGRVVYKDGKSSTAHMNYNMLVNEVLFIDSRRYALLKSNPENKSLAQPQSVLLKDVEYISIGPDYFINTDRGLMLLIADYPVRLLQHNTITMSGETKTGAYGQAVETAAVESRTKVPDAPTAADLNPQVATEFSRKTAYFLFFNNKLYPATKGQFEKLFPQKKEELKQYFSSAKPDFGNMEYLKELLKYCFTQQ